MEIVTRNPCDQLERPKVSPSPPRGLSADDIRRLLAAIPQTPSGLRDRAITITLALTGRRRTEVLSLKVRDIIRADAVFYQYRGKGNKKGKRELPQPPFDAINTGLAGPGANRSIRCGKASRSGRHPRGGLYSIRLSTRTFGAT